jgi:hypothetical protein
MYLIKRIERPWYLPDYGLCRRRRGCLAQGLAAAAACETEGCGKICAPLPDYTMRISCPPSHRGGGHNSVFFFLIGQTKGIKGHAAWE